MKTLTSFAAILFLALSCLGQDTSSYRVDNFDFENGVRVELPQAPPPRGRRSPRTFKLLSREYSGAQIPAAELSTSLEGFTTGNRAFDTLILESGKRNSVDPLLLYSIMHQESTFKASAISPKGASGLMQLMPATARRFGVASIFEPRQNIEGGARYMRFLLDLFEGDIELALAGYNAGEGAVMKYGYQIPPYRETQEYVRRISKRYNLIRDPMTATNLSGLTQEQLIALQQRQSLPLNIYERSVFAVRLPDGRLQLISQ